jgi:hypothetical protein
MINKDSYRLLQRLFDIELDKFKVLDGSISMLSKESRNLECQESIVNFMETRQNSTFFIYNTENNERSTMGLIISNVVESNDHEKYYKITIASSCETYQVEEIVEFPNHTRIIKNYDKSKV